MENSVSEPESHKSFQSPPRRRRSTFFERRNSVIQIPQPTVDLHKKVTKSDDEEHESYLSRYHELLLTEKDQWKKEVKDRRNKYHDLRHQYEIATTVPSRANVSYSALTNEDIEFIKGKPNLNKLIDSQMRLHKSVKETIALFRRASELDDVILRYSEDKVNKVTNYILDHSSVEPTE